MASVLGAFPTTSFKYSGEYDQTATDRAALDELNAAEGQRVGRLFDDRVAGRESLAQEQQRAALANAQRQMAGAAAAGRDPLAQRQAMIGGTRMSTDIMGQAGAARQKEIMAGRAMMGDVYAQQSARALALQDMENKRRQAAQMAELERMRGDMIAEQGKMAMYSQIMGGAMQAAGGGMAMGATAGGGGGQSQTAQTGQALGSQSYGAMGSGGQTYWSPNSYNINDYMDTYGMQEIGPNAK